jgi:hypothetical protein
MKKLLALAAMLAVTLSIIVADQTPASAHVSGGTHGGDGHDAAVTADYEWPHFGITVCDNERDGHYAYVRVHLTNGVWVEERDGGDAGCDTEWWVVNYDLFYVCEEAKGCWGPYYP